MTRLAYAAIAVLLTIQPLTAYAQLNITITPEAPPEAQGVVNRLLGLIMWGAWMAAIGFGAIYAVKLMAGDKEGAAKLRNWVLGLMLLASLFSIVNWLAGG